MLSTNHNNFGNRGQNILIGNNKIHGTRFKQIVFQLSCDTHN